MRKRIPRWRLHAPALLLLVLAGCNAADHTSAVARRAAAIDPPQLWLAEALDGDGRVTAGVWLCTDSVLQAGLSRVRAEVNGEFCQPVDTPVERGAVYALRCEIGGRLWGLTANTTGDRATDFTVRTALTALEGPAAKAVSVRRYRWLGPCPAGWRVGDEARG